MEEIRQLTKKKNMNKKGKKKMSKLNIGRKQKGKRWENEREKKKKWESKERGKGRMRKIKRKCLKIKTGRNVRTKKIGKRVEEMKKKNGGNEQRKNNGTGRIRNRKRNWWKKRVEEWNMERDEKIMEKGREWKS